MNAPLEIERKFLIRMPNPSLLSEQPNVTVKQITQIYLLAEAGCMKRVRKSVMKDGISYRKTEKKRLSALTAIEEETELSEKEYTSLLSLADPERKPIEKVRYTFPYEGHLLEIDIYPF